jgi:hypothetical protein
LLTEHSKRTASGITLGAAWGDLPVMTMGPSRFTVGALRLAGARLEQRHDPDDGRVRMPDFYDALVGRWMYAGAASPVMIGAGHAP